MELTTIKQALRDSDRKTVREVLDTYGEDVLEAAVALGINPSDISDAYQGRYRSDEDFAQQLAEDLGSIDKNASWPYTCIDWEEAAQELLRFDYVESNGHYFRNL